LAFFAATLLLDHGHDALAVVVLLDDAEDVAVAEEVRRHRRIIQHVGAYSLHINENVAQVVSRHHEGTRIEVKVADLAKTPATNVSLVNDRVIKDVGDVLLPIVNENVFVVVPAHS